jgi:hypothetical protein
MLQEAQLFNWLKKNKSIEPTMAQPERGETAPFEILLPDDLMNSGVPDLRIASKFLALLVESELPMQHLEIHHDMPLVNSPYQPIKQFLSTINGAKQLQKFLEQVEFMLFKARNPREGANKQVISSQADSPIKISRSCGVFFPQTPRTSLF